MREIPTLWERRSQANKKFFRAGRENIDNPAAAHFGGAIGVGSPHGRGGRSKIWSHRRR